MIRLTRLNHEPFYLNPDLIVHVESTPDTVIALTTGTRIVVEEPAGEVARRVIEMRRTVLGSGPLPGPGAKDCELA